MSPVRALATPRTFLTQGLSIKQITAENRLQHGELYPVVCGDLSGKGTYYLKEGVHV